MFDVHFYNTLDDIYSSQPFGSAFGYRCPVCHKDFKTIKGVTRHYEKRACHKLKHVFEGTRGEVTLYHLYRKLCEAERRFPYSLENFRKTRFYTLIGKFMLFCMTNTLLNYEEYLWFVIRELKPDTLIKAVSLAVNEKYLLLYRQWKVFHINDEQSAAFYQAYRTFLTSDIHFVLRSFEKGELSPSYYFSKVELFDFYALLSDAQKKRLETFLTLIEGKA